MPCSGACTPFWAQPGDFIAAEELEELLKREKEQGIKDVDPWLDAFMKAEVRKGKRKTVVSDYIIKILGLDVSADERLGGVVGSCVLSSQVLGMLRLALSPDQTLFSGWAS